MTTAAYFLWIALVLAAGYSRQLLPAVAAWASWILAATIAAAPPRKTPVHEIVRMLRDTTPRQWRTLMPSITAEQFAAIQQKVAKVGDDLDAAAKAAGQNAQDNAAVAQAQNAVSGAQADAAASLAAANALAQAASQSLSDLSSYLDALVAPTPAPAPAPTPAPAVK